VAYLAAADWPSNYANQLMQLSASNGSMKMASISKWHQCINVMANENNVSVANQQY